MKVCGLLQDNFDYPDSIQIAPYYDICFIQWSIFSYNRNYSVPIILVLSEVTKCKFTILHTIRPWHRNYYIYDDDRSFIASSHTQCSISNMYAHVFFIT